MGWLYSHIIYKINFRYLEKTISMKFSNIFQVDMDIKTHFLIFHVIGIVNLMKAKVLSMLKWRMKRLDLLEVKNTD